MTLHFQYFLQICNWTFSTTLSLALTLQELTKVTGNFSSLRSNFSCWIAAVFLHIILIDLHCAQMDLNSSRDYAKFVHLFLISSEILSDHVAAYHFFPNIWSRATHVLSKSAIKSGRLYTNRINSWLQSPLPSTITANTMKAIEPVKIEFCFIWPFDAIQFFSNPISIIVFMYWKKNKVINIVSLILPVFFFYLVPFQF